MIDGVDPEELDAVVTLIAGEQAHPARNITYLGVEARALSERLGFVVDAAFRGDRHRP